MGLFKQAGGKVWWLDICKNGRRVRKSTGTPNKKLAEAVYCKVQSQMVEGTYLNVSKTRTMTVNDLIARYLKEVTPGKAPTTQRDDRFYAKRLVTAFGKLYLHEVTADRITRHVLKRRKKVGPYAVNRELAFFSAAYTKAWKLWGWANENPVTKVKREKERKRVKFFSPEEFAEIFQHLAEWIQPLVLLAKNTGLRASNLVNLKWKEVYIKNKIILLEGEVMKNDQALGLPLNEVALKVITGQHKKRKLHFTNVFCHKNGTPYTIWGLSRSFKKACVAAGYPEFRFHDLRHGFCSQLVQRGVGLYTVKELAGHQDITTTQRYAHLSPKELVNAVEVLNCHKSAIAEEKGSSVGALNP